MKQSIVVRKDLKMRKGKLAAQCCHGSNMVLYNYFGTDKIIKWLEDDYKKIVLGCNSEQELFDLKNKCTQYNLIHFLVKDFGYTEFKEPTFTCICIGPEEDDKIDSVCGKFDLL